MMPQRSPLTTIHETRGIFVTALQPWYVKLHIPCLSCSAFSRIEVCGLEENTLLQASQSRAKVYSPCAFVSSKPPSSSRSPMPPSLASLPPRLPPLPAGRSYQGKDVSAAFPPQPLLQEPLSPPRRGCCHRRWSLTCGLQEPNKEAPGSPCAPNLLSLSRDLAAGAKAAEGWAGSGQSAQALATGLSCTQGLPRSFDILEDPGRKCLRKTMWQLQTNHSQPFLLLPSPQSNHTDWLLRAAS